MIQAQVGDVVERWVGGRMMMRLTVTEVDDKLITCGVWTFDRVTGGEVDDVLGWTAHQTGSYLKVKGVTVVHLTVEGSPIC